MNAELWIGPAPIEEPCAQLGEIDYTPRALEECNRLISLIRKKCGTEPPGAKLRVKSSPHDFGLYYEVICGFETDDAQAVEYAYRVESDTPVTWDDDGSQVAEDGDHICTCQECGKTFGRVVDR